MLLNPYRFGGNGSSLQPFVTSSYRDQPEEGGATATFTLGASCAGATETVSGSTSFVLCDPIDAALFEAVCTLSSGTFSTGGGSQTVPLATGNTWTVSRPTIGVKTAVMAVQIRRISDGAIMSSGSFTLSAQRIA